jgi:rubredoxin
MCFEKSEQVHQVNELRKKPPIPEMPKTIEECEALLRKSLERLASSGPQEGYQPGMIAKIAAEMRCPFCGMKFTQFIESGCFGGSFTPYNCPNCGFPGSIHRKWFELSRAEKDKKDSPKS